jgi:hypothetical protein
MNKIKTFFKKIFNFLKKLPSKLKTIDKTFLKIIFFCLILLLIVLVIPKLTKYQKPNANVLLVLEANEPMDGLMHWQIELDNKFKTATVLVSKELAEKYPDFFINMHGRGYTLVGYSTQDFWQKSYEDQLQIIKETKDVFNNILEIEMNIFATKNFSYNTDTLKIAQDLNIEYIFARGTTKEKATIYDVQDYDVKLISLSNVKDSNLNSTPISDYDLHIRGADIVEWEKHINDSITKNAKSISIISNSYLGGTKKAYWDIYWLLLRSNHVDINDFETWVSKTKKVSLKNIEIPINKENSFKEVYYTPINKLEDIRDVSKYKTTPKAKGECPKGGYCY